MQELALECARIDAEQAKSAELLRLDADYRKTLAAVRALKEGKISPDNINLVAGGWSLVPSMLPVSVSVDTPPDESIHIADVATD